MATGERLVLLPGYPYSTSIPVYTVITNGEPGPVQRYPRGVTAMWDIGCPTATRCLAVADGITAVLTGAGSSWAVTALVPGDVGDKISCPSSTRCYTTSYQFRPVAGGSFRSVPAMVALTADGVASQPQPLTDRPGIVYGISCVAEGVCTLVGRDYGFERALVIDVGPGQPPVVTLGASETTYQEVSCISATACGIVGTAGGPPIGVFSWKD